MREIAVVGAGAMGAQIAQQAALNGLIVRLYDSNGTQLDRAGESNRTRLTRRVERRALSRGDMEEALGRVHSTTSLEDAVGGVEFVIEAVFENLEVKRQVFSDLDRVAAPTAVLATNSSTMGISKLIDPNSRAHRCMNMHFFHPVLVMDLVELVRGPQTSDETVARAIELAHAMGRTPVVLNREIDGFIVNRIMYAATQEAYRLMDSGVASYQDIDIAVEKGLNWPLGPFRLGDFSGLDTTYMARLQLYQSTGDERFRPSPQLERKVKEGKHGRKTGEGWYRYEL